MIANLTANNPFEWIDTYKFKSSHTNSAQWIIIDQNLVKHAKGDRDLIKDTIIVLENLGDS